MNRDFDFAEIRHVDGVAWHDAPIPPAVHHCTPQTTAYDALGLPTVERCACGGIRLSAYNPFRDHPWINVNERRQDLPNDWEHTPGRASRWVALIALIVLVLLVVSAL